MIIRFLCKHCGKTKENSYGDDPKHKTCKACKAKRKAKRKAARKAAYKKELDAARRAPFTPAQIASPYFADKIISEE